MKTMAKVSINHSGHTGCGITIISVGKMGKFSIEATQNKKISPTSYFQTSLDFIRFYFLTFCKNIIDYSLLREYVKWLDKENSIKIVNLDSAMDHRAFRFATRRQGIKGK